MTWTPVQSALLRQFASKFPVPQKKMDESIENFEQRAREWTTKVAEQFCFSLGSDWGAKRAGTGRPLSKDTVRCKRDGLQCWDIMTGTGTGQPVLQPDNPTVYYIPDQIFVPVAPVNWVGVPVNPPPTPTDPPPSGLEARVARLEAKFKAVASLLA
jgi:hypothetical protein